MASTAQKRAVMKYDKKAYFRTLVRIRKEEEDAVRDAASMAGETLNGYIVHAIHDRMSGAASSAPAPADRDVLPADIMDAARAASETVGQPVWDFLRRAVTDETDRDGKMLRMGIDPVTRQKIPRPAPPADDPDPTQAD